jgi:uncharacterized protein (TIGR02147 family)
MEYKNLPCIFDYFDYRKYLKDVISILEKQEQRFSFRAFSRRAGYTSPNFVQGVIAGKRKFNHAAVLGTAQTLGLTKLETEFFANLVGFNEAKTQDKKDLYYQRLVRSPKTKVLDKKQYDFASCWYNPVVRELLVHPGYTGEPAWIAARTEPVITPAQVVKSIETMESLGLIKKNEQTGKWEQANTSISTPPEVQALSIRQYHKGMLALAERALDAIPPEKRDIRGLTIGISTARFPELKQRLTSFWGDLLKEYADQDRPEMVYQLNLQFFPLLKEKL